MKDKKFKLFSCCVITNGVNRAVITDFQRETFYFFPNEIIDLLNEYSDKTIYDLFKDFENDKPVLKKYIRHFLENELVFITDEPNNFLPINDDFVRPFALDILTIDLNLLKRNETLFSKIGIDRIGSSCIRLLLCEPAFNDYLEKALVYIKESKISEVILFVNYTDETVKRVTAIEKNNPIITQVVFYNCYQKIEINEEMITNYHYFPLPLESVLSMKVSRLDDFVPTMEFFNESLRFNQTYNRTVYIDEFGDIKRYCNDKGVFGNIERDSIEKVIVSDYFQEFWTITKDKIKVCKDCEFRYVCPDGTIPYKEIETNPHYSTPTKCNYDPYQNRWKTSMDN